MVSSAHLTDHLRHHADRYFADVRGEGVHVQLRHTSRRTNSTLHEFVVGGGETEHVVLVKQPSRLRLPTPHAAAGQDRPRLFPKALPEWKSRFEFEAMAAIERHVDRLDDPRFGAVRVLELLPDQQSLVMEKINQRSLSRLLQRSPFVPASRPSRQQLDQILRNSGSWLRRYHDLPGLEHTQSRGASRAMFVDSIFRFTGYLARATGDSSFERLGRELADLAEVVLPLALPLGLAHGDYAPRNILAAPTGQIYVIDTLARWQAPVYEDISHFLTAIKASTSQALSRGLVCRRRTVAHLERQLLAGYFENQTVPLDRIRLFECQMLVERWAGLTYRSREARGWKRIVKGGRAAWSCGFLRKLINRLLGEARPGPAAITLCSRKVVR